MFFILFSIDPGFVEGADANRCSLKMARDPCRVAGTDLREAAYVSVDV